MTIYAMHDVFPEMGRIRAETTGRAWFLMQDTRSGRQRMTDDPMPSSSELVVQVFTPPRPAPDATDT